MLAISNRAKSMAASRSSAISAVRPEPFSTCPLMYSQAGGIRGMRLDPDFTEVSLLVPKHFPLCRICRICVLDIVVIFAAILESN